MVKLKVVKPEEPATQKAPQTPVAETMPWEPENADQVTTESVNTEPVTDQPGQQPEPEPETLPITAQSDSSDSQDVTEKQPTVEQPAIYEEITATLQEINAAECDIIRAKSQVKAAQNRFDEAQEKLREINYRLIENTNPPKAQPATTNNATATPSATATSSNAWRTVPITALDLDKVEGLGNKKREALLDSIPNMGALEDARVAAGASHFATQLPKGFGEKIADQLVDLFLAWSVENPHLFLEQPATASEPTAKDDAILPPFGNMTDADQIAYLENRFIEIELGQSWDCQGNQDAYNQGKSDADNLDNYTDCIYTDYDAIDDYLRGYLSARGEAMATADNETTAADTQDDIDNI